MDKQIIIVGTDTDVGKTVFAAALVSALDGQYWKPVQAGLEGGTDSTRLMALGRVPADCVLPEAYRLATPVSPHLAAEIDGVKIDPARLEIPSHDRLLVIEGAGGLLTPLTREWLYIDQIAKWGAPVVLVGRTSLGAINHALLSLEALRARNITVIGMAFVGDPVPDTEQVICEMAKVKRLGRLPHLSPLIPESLKKAFRDNFQLADFASGCS